MNSDMMRSPAPGTNKLLRQYQSPTIRNLTAAAAQQLVGKPLTPRNHSSFCTPNALQRKGGGRFHVFQPVNDTPPSRQPKKVHNPFEAALVERLHLPLIGSPSLFQLPRTPQHSSTQFEWTIDEVSSLNPSNVEAHETQFISINLDPEQEAKAQAAISTYFKDKLSVPSPIDCPLRNKKIILPSTKKTIVPRHLRDAICQTELTIPPILPPELEAALRPFCTFTQDQQQSPLKPTNANTTIDHDARDASLRRKLFETSLNSTDSDDFHVDMVQCLSPAPTSPEIGQSRSDTRNFQSPQDHNNRSLNISLSPVRNTTDDGCSSFGSLSPISRNASSPSPAAHSKSQNRSRICMNSSSIYQSTPGTTSDIFRTCNSLELAADMSVDITVASRSKTRSAVLRNLSKSFGSDQNSMFMDDDEDVENMPPISSSRPNSSASGAMHDDSPNSSSHSGTPSRKLRRANRRNLSLSFGSNDSMKESEPMHAVDAEPMNGSFGVPTTMPISQTDSGFNEMEE